MVINTQWVELSGIASPDVAVWKWLVMGVAMVILFVPFYWWKERRARAWRWWRSTLFVAGWFCVVLPVVALTAGGIIGDTYAKADADAVVAQVIAAHSAVAPTAPVVVEQSENAKGSILDVPYQGDQFDYRIRYAAAAQGGPAVQCRVVLSLFRQKAPRGRTAPVFARISGDCGPLAPENSGVAPGPAL